MIVIKKVYHDIKYCQFISWFIYYFVKIENKKICDRNNLES